MLVTRATFDECLARVTSDRLVVDTETTGLIPYARSGRPADRVIGVAVKSHDETFYFPTRHAHAKNIDESQYARLVERLSKAEEFVGHNTKFDVAMLAQDGLPLPKVMTDTSVGSFLYNENESHKLKPLGDKYLGVNASHEAEKLDKLLLQWGLGKGDMWRLDPSYVAEYAEQDVKLADSLDVWLRTHLYSPSLYTEVSDFARVLCDMEMTGIWANRETIGFLRHEASTKARGLLTDLQALAGFPINPNSPKQVTGWLKCADSTEATLQKLDHVGASLILDYRAWQKAVDTYYNQYANLVDGRSTIHTRYHPTGTVAGRISSADPNMQAVPRRTEEQKVKDLFQAREGYFFAEFDYSQAEIRLGAHYTGEAAIMEILANRGDIHTIVSKKLGIPRQAGKTINLSIVYGIGAIALSEKLNIEKKKAQEFLDAYHKEYTGFRRVMRAAEKTAEVRGFIQMWTGRRRHFNVREAETRKSFSNLIQGGVGEIVRLAMCRVHKEIPRSSARMLLQVHDSILFEVKIGEEEVLHEIKGIMEDQPWCRVKMIVDMKVGQTWGGLK